VIRSLMLVLLVTVAACAEEAVPQRRPSLGISIDLTVDPLAPAEGLVVTEVRSGSNGERLGLVPGDRIVAVDGVPIHEAQQLQAALGDKQAEAPIVLTVQRGGTSLDLAGVLRRETGIGGLAARAEQLSRDLAELRGGDPAVQARYSLQDLLVILRQIERDLPAAAAEFKQVYPQGRFKIGIHIDIDSHADPEPDPESDPDPEPAREAAP
jgi:predicted metalloprotease with PDZ domain